MSDRTNVAGWKSRELIYQYDGSYDGFLCCVFESFLQKELPSEIRGGEPEQMEFAPVKQIETDRLKAERVRRSIPRKMSRSVEQFVQYGFLTCLEGKERYLLEFLRQGYHYGAGVMNRLADPTVNTLFQAVKALKNEAHLLTGFIRFSIYDGILVSTIGPKNFVLPVISSHFCHRYPGETFLIYDETHQAALIHQADGKTDIVAMEHLELAAPDKEEITYQKLWTMFYHTIAVEGRENPRCRMSHMPKRYWRYMTEFSESSQM